MKLSLDPPSGYADSYSDIKFVVYPEIPHGHTVSISLTNETASLSLDILGVSSGYIKNESVAVFESGVPFVEGYINLFNKDKMNTSLSQYFKVRILCTMTYDNKTETKYVDFYNQSKSVDGHIIPFDLNLKNKNIDENNPLVMKFYSSVDKKYEIMIKNSKKSFTFDVMLTKGYREVELPFEVIKYELGIANNQRYKFDLYWLKYEGINYSKIMNKIPILINNSTMNISSIGELVSQNRVGPLGVNLSNNFVLSDRYFVHTHEDFSAFGGKNNLHYGRMAMLTTFIHEAQNIQKVNKSISLFSESESIISKNRKELRQSKLQKLSIPAEKDIGQISNKYLNQANVFAAPSNANEGQPTKNSGCGCSRKK